MPMNGGMPGGNIPGGGIPIGPMGNMPGGGNMPGSIGGMPIGPMGPGGKLESPWEYLHLSPRRQSPRLKSPHISLPNLSNVACDALLLPPFREELPFDAPSFKGMAGLKSCEKRHELPLVHSPRVKSLQNSRPPRLRLRFGRLRLRSRLLLPRLRPRPRLQSLLLLRSRLRSLPLDLEGVRQDRERPIEGRLQSLDSFSELPSRRK
mmetsp:Transcript_24131/g.56137  ORF Transcript_24131/g.56137 Transcript_24131/m.56137 type:complete len:206 (+) Transcript_24131:339-956(+)